MKATTNQINGIIDQLLSGIRKNRSSRSARVEVREAILRVRQLRGILEARTIKEA